MKLTSDPKPVKFRIVSGGEEHSSLDSLRRNLCIEDLQKNEQQFLHWLSRQGKEGEDIAQELQAMPTALSNCTSLEEFFEVYKILFKDIIPFFHVDSLGKVYEWFWYNENRYSKNLLNLHNVLWGVDEKYTMSSIEKAECITEEMATLLVKFDNAYAHFLLSKYYFEVKHNIRRGKKLLEQAIAEGCKEAKAYTIDIKSIENYNKWPDIDIEYMKAHIEYLISKQEYNYPHDWTENEKEMHRFVADCLSIANKTYSFYEDAYNDALKCFGTKRKGRNNEYSINDDFLYEQKLFVIHIIELAVNRFYDDAIEGLRKQSEFYYPAKYLIDKSEKHPLWDKDNFRWKGWRIKIKLLLLNLFEF